MGLFRRRPKFDLAAAHRDTLEMVSRSGGFYGRGTAIEMWTNRRFEGILSSYRGQDFTFQTLGGATWKFSRDQIESCREIGTGQVDLMFHPPAPFMAMIMTPECDYERWLSLGVPAQPVPQAAAPLSPLSALACLVDDGQERGVTPGTIGIVRSGYLRFTPNEGGPTVKIRRQDVVEVKPADRQPDLLAMTLGPVLPWTMLLIELEAGMEARWRAWHEAVPVGPES